LKKAANTTAWAGLSTPVDTTVAIEFAASWKPFMKSNSSAMHHQQDHDPEGRLGRFHAASSGVLEDDALDDVGDVLALVGDGLQQLVDGLELDHLAHVRLLAEQLAHGARITRSASDSSRSISSQVLSAASATSGPTACPAGHRVLHALAAAHAQVGEAQISSVMCRTSYSAMVSAESWIRSATSSIVLISVWICSRSIGVMKVEWISRLTSCGDLVGRALGVVDLAVVLLAQVHVVVVRTPAWKSTRALDDALGVLVEHFEEVAFAGQQICRRPARQALQQQVERNAADSRRCRPTAAASRLVRTSRSTPPAAPVGAGTTMSGAGTCAPVMAKRAAPARHVIASRASSKWWT
jgi:hypothetical protein